MKTKPLIIGISGGSGSGKTFFANQLAKSVEKTLGPSCCSVLLQDHYYRDQSQRFDHDGGAVNFDHPDAIDFELLTEHVRQLKSGLKVEVPIYDFATHKRLMKTNSMEVTPIILVDGILIFHPPRLREQFDDLIFFDTPEELRFSRRLERDTRERGRTPEGVHNQFYKQVKPMHDLFVEPAKHFANLIVKDQGECEGAVELTARDLISKLGR